jgi:hypothetical protein
MFKIVQLSEVPPDRGCEEKARLAMEYEAATSTFLATVNELHLKVGTSPRAEYERLEWISIGARVKSEQARLALEQHIAAHCC